MADSSRMLEYMKDFQRSQRNKKFTTQQWAELYDNWAETYEQVRNSSTLRSDGHLNMSHLISFHLISSHLTSSYVISFYVISSHLISSHLILQINFLGKLHFHLNFPNNLLLAIDVHKVINVH